VRHGSGAFVSLNRRRKSLADHISQARQRVGDLIGDLRGEGLRDDEIRRVFEAELLLAPEPGRKR
jgi:hypothetical protein